MRRINILTYIIISAAFCCCSTKESEETPIDTTGYTYFNVDLESLSTGNSDYEAVWTKGTGIGVFGSECGVNEKYNLRQADEDKRTALFYGPLVKGEVLAYTPYVENQMLSDGKLPLMLSQTQQHLPQIPLHEHFISYCNMALAVQDQSGVLSFRWPAGVLGVRFDFNEPISVSSIILESGKPISGHFLVDSNCRTYATDNSLNRIELAFDGAVVSETAEGKVLFYFVMPADIYEAGDLSIEVTDGNEPIHIKLPEVEIYRAGCGIIPVTEVKVGASLLPGFEKEDGFLE